MGEITLFVKSETVDAMIIVGIVLLSGQVSERLRTRPAESEFERGARRFGYLLTEVTFVLVLIILGVSVYLARPVWIRFSSPSPSPSG